MLNLELVPQLQELQQGLVDADWLESEVRSRRVVILKARTRPVAVGPGTLVKVNASIGLSVPASLDAERKKLRLLSDAPCPPDCMMDLTNVLLNGKQFYDYMLEGFDGPVGTLPHYTAFHPDKGIDKEELIDRTWAQAEAGVSFMTLHPTPTRELYEKSKRTRLTPTSSRGGGIVIQDMYLNNRKQNVIAECFPELTSILKRHSVALSIGSTFRPVGISEALDEAHVEEIALQGTFVREAQRVGVAVQMEGIGHIALTQIPRYLRLATVYNVPLVPLGPLPTDAAVGRDHIANAIGAAHAALLGGAHMIHSVTREEHTGGVPSEDSVIEGLEAARIAAHVVNICMFPGTAAVDKHVSSQRASRHTCAVPGGLLSQDVAPKDDPGCARCNLQCPFRMCQHLTSLTRDRTRCQ